MESIQKQVDQRETDEMNGSELIECKGRDDLKKETNIAIAPEISYTISNVQARRVVLTLSNCKGLVFDRNPLVS